MASSPGTAPFLAKPANDSAAGDRGAHPLQHLRRQVQLLGRLQDLVSHFLDAAPLRAGMEAQCLEGLVAIETIALHDHTDRGTGLAADRERPLQAGLATAQGPDLAGAASMAGAIWVTSRGLTR
jgi:hypothetical protein